MEMAQIKLFNFKTYPDTVTKVRKKLQTLPDNIKRELHDTEFLCDYTNSAMWNVEAPFGQLHQELMLVLEPHEIVAYHNTRLSDKKSIENHGLIFTDKKHISILRVSLQAAGIDHQRIKEVLSAVVRERYRWKSSKINVIRNEVCFIYDMDYYHGLL